MDGDGTGELKVKQHEATEVQRGDEANKDERRNTRAEESGNPRNKGWEQFESLSCDSDKHLPCPHELHSTQRRSRKQEERRCQVRKEKPAALPTAFLPLLFKATKCEQVCQDKR